MITANVITLGDNLQGLVQEINQAAWDDTNEMCAYDVAALTAYLTRQDTVFVACHEIAEAGRTLLGIASARLEMKPYGNECWLYVDEVDVCADQRRQGAGRRIMQRLIEFAWKADCREVWLGTELDNTAANALYRSLKPHEIDEFVGYAFERPESGDTRPRA